MRYSDELRGSDGEWCQIQGRRAIIRAVHDGGVKVTVQFEDDNATGIFHYSQVQLEGEETV